MQSGPFITTGQRHQCCRNLQFFRYLGSFCRGSAQHAVRAIFGSKDPYDYLPFFYSREFTLSWQFYGVNEGKCTLFGSMDDGQRWQGGSWQKQGV